jgi:hypothetical protein
MLEYYQSFHVLWSIEMSQWLLFITKWAFFPSYVAARTIYIPWDTDDFRLRLDQHAYSWMFDSVSSLMQQSAFRHVAPLGHIILITTL